jgi:hypothetical protein
MRPFFALSIALLLAAAAPAQLKEVPPRFDIIHNPDLYGQRTPQETLRSVLTAVAGDRYDYIVAHLLDPAYVEARLQTTQAYYEKLAAEQVAATASGAALRGPELQARVTDIATRMNVRQLADAMRKKMADEPDNLKDLRRFARDAEFKDAGESATATLKDVKDRAVYFKKVGDLWFLENRKDERPPAKE